VTPPKGSGEMPIPFLPGEKGLVDETRIVSCKSHTPC